MDCSLSALDRQKVVPEIFHHESGPAQYEISIRPAVPLKAADDSITLRDTIKAISRNFGYNVTFCPKPFVGLPGSGLHLNISLWRDGTNCMASRKDHLQVSEEGVHFISGILEGFSALSALCCPTHNSHKRLGNGNWSGGAVRWNYSDREAAVRITRNGNSPITHLEFRAIDSTANPYLALGGIIQLGIDGIRRKANCLPSESSAREFPNFHESIEALENNDILVRKLGARLVKAYKAVRVSDYQYASTLDEQDSLDQFTLRY